MSRLDLNSKIGERGVAGAVKHTCDDGISVSAVLFSSDRTGSHIKTGRDVFEQSLSCNIFKQIE